MYWKHFQNALITSIWKNRKKTHHRDGKNEQKTMVIK